MCIICISCPTYSLMYCAFLFVLLFPAPCIWVHTQHNHDSHSIQSQQMSTKMSVVWHHHQRFCGSICPIDGFHPERDFFHPEMWTYRINAEHFVLVRWPFGGSDPQQGKCSPQEPDPPTVLLKGLHLHLLCMSNLSHGNQHCLPPHVNWKQNLFCCCNWVVWKHSNF